MGAIENTVTLDYDFFGMTPVHASSNPTVEKDRMISYFGIIAVTGLSGHAFGSWKSPNGYTMWLGDALPEDLDGIRVFTYGYDSILKESTCNSSLQQYSRQFLDAVNDIRSNSEEVPKISTNVELQNAIINHQRRNNVVH
ncbi:hypothetical protein BDD12DRAFT_877295 [Trichophaea hybrida]|nr:hypothetical protein BDD12DRAFT_877295 [Trichophaea hybrida]